MSKPQDIRRFTSRKFALASAVTAALIAQGAFWQAVVVACAYFAANAYAGRY